MERKGIFSDIVDEVATYYRWRADCGHQLMHLALAELPAAEKILREADRVDDLCEFYALSCAVALCKAEITPVGVIPCFNENREHNALKFYKRFRDLLERALHESLNENSIFI